MLVFAGAVGPLIILVVQQISEGKRHRARSLEDRLTELIDRLQDGSHFVRAASVSGLADLAVKCAVQKGEPTSTAIGLRALVQVGIMLSTEQEGNVQESLVNSVKHLWKNLPPGPYQATLIREVRSASACAYRWVVGNLAYMYAAIGEKAAADSDPAITALMANFYGLKPELLDDLKTEVGARNLLVWNTFRFEHDGKADIQAVRRFGNSLYRYQTCLRSWRLVSQLGIECSKDQDYLAFEDDEYTGGMVVMHPEAAIALISQVSVTQ